MPRPGGGSAELPEGLCFKIVCDGSDNDEPVSADSPDYYADGSWIVTRDRHLAIVQTCGGLSGPSSRLGTPSGRLVTWCVAELVESSGGTIRFRVRPFLCMWYEHVEYEGQPSYKLTRKAKYIEAGDDDELSEEEDAEDLKFELVWRPDGSIVLHGFKHMILFGVFEVTTWTSHHYREFPLVLLEDAFTPVAKHRLMDYIDVQDRWSSCTPTALENLQGEDMHDRARRC